MSTHDTEEIPIHEELYKEIEKMSKQQGFDSVEEYVNFVFNELAFSNQDLENEDIASSAEVQEKLKSLGYI